jgi:putative flippase GtrA
LTSLINRAILRHNITTYTFLRLAERWHLKTPLSISAALTILYSQNRKEANRFIKFAIVGTIGAAVDFSVLNLAYKAFGLPLVAANTLSFTLAVLSNFTWNRLWTFPESRARPIRSQLPQFALVNVVGLVINNLILLGLHVVFSSFINDPWDYNLAKAVAIVIVLFWNFGANRLWTYRGL